MKPIGITHLKKKNSSCCDYAIQHFTHTHKHTNRDTQSLLAESIEREK